MTVNANRVAREERAERTQAVMSAVTQQVISFASMHASPVLAAAVSVAGPSTPKL